MESVVDKRSLQGTAPYLEEILWLGGVKRYHVCWVHYSLKLIHKISLFLYFTVVVEVVEEIFMAQDRCYSLHRFLTKTINVAQPLGFVVEQNTQQEISLV
jgi:hypothetical protein